MASRNGPVTPSATGGGTNDGTDFKHREVIASHYTVSVENKSRLSFAIFMHWMLGVVLILRLLPSVCQMVGVRVPQQIRQLNMPDAQLYELGWLVSLFGCVLARFALRKNNSFLMLQFVIGQIVFGLGGCFYGLVDRWPVAAQYFVEKAHATVLFFGFPFVFLQYLFLIIMLQIHMLEIWTAFQLRSAWAAATKDKKRH